MNRVVGNYTLERPLGHGGMGSVWLARRSDGRFEGRAAIKFLDLALVDPLGVERFGQTGNLADLYAAYRLDGDAITEAVAELLLPA